MATYRLGFYAFDVLDVADADGTSRSRAGDRPARDLLAPGTCLRLRPAAEAVAFVLVEEDDAGSGRGTAALRSRGARIAPGSPVGEPGSVVWLSGRLALGAGEAGRPGPECGILTIGAAEVGLLVRAPLGADLAHRVIAVQEAAVGAALRGFAWQGDVLGGRANATNPGFGFVAGTRIDTPAGPRPIEELAPGDLVTTLDNGSQPLRWIGRRSFGRDELVANPALRPIRFEPGALGNARPLLVAQSHRLLLSDWRAQVYFGEDQVLIAAKALANGQTACQLLPEAGLTYLHLLFDRHEVILSEGALSESFHPGEAGLAALEDHERMAIEARFPGLALARRRAAFPIVRPAEARALRLLD
jgi:hypothetical protein